ncbi:molybdenum cofactor guanylyltransferase MobA [Pseudomonadota bacterium]
MEDKNSILGVLLAGGLSRRFGGDDKFLREIGGETLLQRVAARAAPQVGELILNAGGDAERFGDLGLPVVPDVVEGALGPLAGVLTGMAWAREHRPETQWIATFATDAPFLPEDLVIRLHAAAHEQGASIALASSDGRAHPVFGLWSVDLYDNLHAAVVDEGLRKVMAWCERHPLVQVDFTTDPYDPFFNINCEDDLAAAAALLP